MTGHLATTPSLHGTTALVAGDVSRVPGALDALTAAGATVVVQVQTPVEAAAAEAAQRSSRHPEQVEVREQRVSDFASAERLFEDLGAKGAAPGIVITPALPTQTGSLLDFDQAEWLAIRENHLKRSVGLARAAARTFTSGSVGRLLTIAAADTFSSVGVARAGVSAAMLSLASAVAATVGDDVRANCLVLTSDVDGSDGEVPQARAGLVGSAVLYLCDTEESGRFIYCDGRDVGIYAMPFAVEAANVLVRPDGGQHLGEMLAPLTAIGRE